jgi:OOP family OmpA-OmpF porin/outer membrane immunogenic protein
MKKTLFAIALATAGLVAIPSAFAQDQTDGQKAKQGWYVDGDLGASYVDKGPNKGSNYAGGLTGGYRWAVSDELSAGAELGYVYLGKQDARKGAQYAYYANGGTSGTKSNLRGATLGGTLRWNFTPSWYVSLRGGVFDAHVSGLSDSDAPVRRSASNNLGYYAGVGTGWDINQHWSVGVNYNYYQVNRGLKTVDGQREGTRLHLDTQTLTASAEYRF